MANFVLSKSLRRSCVEAEKLVSYSEEAIMGKSSLGKVAKEKTERAASTVNRPFAASSKSVTKAPSGNFLIMSCRVTAETVVAPLRSIFAGTLSSISISRSVARNYT